MGCCVLVIALISQLFALRRKVYRLMGLPVAEEWYDDEPQQSARTVWRNRIRTAFASTVGRSILAALVVGELTFLAVALPGSDGLIARHRHHLQQVVEFITPASSLPGANDMMCRSEFPATSKSGPPPL